MIPTDLWHERLADERADIVCGLEHRYEGCDDHTHGPYPVDEFDDTHN